MKHRQFTINGYAHLNGVPARTIYTELERVRRKNGGAIQAEAILAAARHETAALHPCFTWDDTAAAHQYRLNEARELIRNVRVIEEEQAPRFAYVHVPPPTGRAGAYKRADDVASSPLELILASTEIRRQIDSLSSRLEDLHARTIQQGDTTRANKAAVAAGLIRQAGAAMDATAEDAS